MAFGAQSYPAPVGGLNARDSLTAMPPQDAVILNNWWVYPSQVSVRKGSQIWTTGYANPVETIVQYAPPSGSNKIFAASGTQIFDVTTQGTSTSVVSGKSNARWQDVSITTPGGNFLYLLNGVDAPMLYDGTTWTPITGASTPAITGVTTTNLVQGCLWKSRLWFTEKNTLKAWYLPALSIGGAAQSVDLGAVCQRGGYLMGVFSWTIDGGAGVDDQLVFITSNGEVVVYQGTDPASITTFALIGVYYVGRPIGRRCAVKFRGDLLTITEEGVFPLSLALQTAAINRTVAITDKISNSISTAMTSYGVNFGWQLEPFQDQNMLILNIPVGNGMNYQYAQSTITGAWTQFSGWDARCWKFTGDTLFFGTGNSVMVGWTSNLDQVGATTYNQIIADALPSFQYFGSAYTNPTYGKFFTMVRPYITTSGAPSILYSLNTNLVAKDPTGSLTYTPPTGMVWGSMVWGQMSMVWGGGLVQLASWNTVGAYATSAAIRLKVQNNSAEVNWSSTDYVFKQSTTVL